MEFIFICGPSCSGKSYYIDYLKKDNKYKKYLVLQTRHFKKKKYFLEQIKLNKNMIIHIDMTGLVNCDKIHYDKLLQNFKVIENKNFKITFKILCLSQKKLIKRVLKRKSQNSWNPTEILRSNKLLELYQDRSKIKNIYIYFFKNFINILPKTINMEIVKATNSYTLLPFDHDFNYDFLKII